MPAGNNVLGSATIQIVPDLSKMNSLQSSLSKSGSAAGAALGSALGKGESQAEAHSTGAAKRIGSAWKGAAGTISSATGGALGPLQELLEKTDAIGEAFDKESRSVGKMALGIGTTLTGAGAALQGFASADKGAEQQLQASIGATGKSYDDYSDKIEETIKTGEKYGTTASSTMDILNQLTVATGSPEAALSSYNAVMDIAATRHISASRAVKAVTSAYSGSATALQKYGITVSGVSTTVLTLDQAQTNQAKAQTAMQTAQVDYQSKLDAYNKTTKHTAEQELALQKAHTAVTDAQNNLKKSTDDLNDAQQGINPNIDKVTAALTNAKSIQGQAAAQADTFSGHMHALTATVEDQVAKFGERWGPTLMKAGPILLAFGAVTETVTGIAGKFKKGQEAAAAATELQTGATEEATVAEDGLNASFLANPIFLVIAAIAALVAGFVLAYQHITPFRDAVDAVGRALKTALIDTVGAVVSAWNGMISFFSNITGAIVGFFRKFGVDILAVIFPFIGIPLLVATHWGQITSFFSKLWGDVEKVFQGALSLLTTIFIKWPQDALSAVAHFGADLGKWISAAVKKLVDTLVSAAIAYFDFWAQLPGKVISAVTRLGGDLVGWIGKAIGMLHDAEWKAIDTALDFFKQLPGKILDALAGAGTWLISVGEDIVKGLMKGIDNMAGEAKDKVKNLGKSLISGAKGLFGIHSPSTVFADIGQNVALGLAQGIAAQTGVVTAAAAAMTQKVIDAGSSASLSGVASSTAVKLISNAGVQSVQAGIFGASADGSGGLDTGSSLGNSMTSAADATATQMETDLVNILTELQKTNTLLTEMLANSDIDVKALQEMLKLDQQEVTQLTNLQKAILSALASESAGLAALSHELSQGKKT